MTVLITQGQTWEAFAEAFRNLDYAVQRNAVQRVFMHKSQMIALDPMREEVMAEVMTWNVGPLRYAGPTKKPRHHDHLLQRHIRSHQPKSRRP
jgi:hypothetical protein